MYAFLKGVKTPLKRRYNNNAFLRCVTLKKMLSLTSFYLALNHLLQRHLIYNAFLILKYRTFSLRILTPFSGYNAFLKGDI